MLTIEKSITYSGNSSINNTVVMYMNASINPNGTFNVNKSIQNNDLYFANTDSVDADYADFNKTVVAEAKSLSTSK